MSSSNNTDADRLEVGRIDKAHGLRGEVVVGLVTNMVAARTAAGAQLWAGSRCLTVVEARAHKNKWLVRFEGVTDRNDADALLGTVLTAPPLPADAVGSGQADGHATEVVAFVHELIGLTVVDQHGVAHGPVLSVMENPAADLLELSEDRLVPLSFYRSHDVDTVTVEVPIGLLDGDEQDDDHDGRS